VNIPLDFVSGNIYQYSLRLRRIIVKYWFSSIYTEREEAVNSWDKGRFCFSSIYTEREEAVKSLPWVPEDIFFLVDTDGSQRSRVNEEKYNLWSQE